MDRRGARTHPAGPTPRPRARVAGAGVKPTRASSYVVHGSAAMAAARGGSNVVCVRGRQSAPSSSARVLSKGASLRGKKKVRRSSQR
jgi:hypothetical protein